jgi:hypothetical protein
MRIAVIVIFMAVTVTAHATQFVPDELIDGGVMGPTVYGYDGRYGDRTGTYDPLEVFSDAAHFISTLQVLESGDDYGGIMEGESESLMEIVQTDNTSESVWVWSRYRQLTDDAQYDEYVDRSWTYILNHPAYEEEGWDEGSKYYRVYNCGWATRCERKYREVTGDDTYKWYGIAAAEFFLDNPINLYASVNNGYCTAWAVGNVYEYAVDIGDDDMKAEALARAVEVKEWAESNPDSTIGLHSWAMAGGATVWGLDRSYFQAHPGEREAWMTTYAPYMPDTVDSFLGWDNAWKAWFALGHWTAFDGGAGAVYWNKFENLADFLAAEDGDDDGGIPANDDDPDDMDQTWVTSYLAMMCMNTLIENTVGIDLTRFEAVPVGANAVEVTWETTGETDIAGFNLYRSEGGPRIKLNGEFITGVSPYLYADADVRPGATYDYWLEAVDVSGASETYGPARAMVPAAAGEYNLAAARPNPSAGKTTFAFTVPEACDVELALYDINGRRIATIYDGPAEAGENAATSDMSLAPGVYVYRLETAGYVAARKMVVVR